MEIKRDVYPDRLIRSRAPSAQRRKKNRERLNARGFFIRSYDSRASFVYNASLLNVGKLLLKEFR